MGAPIRFSWFNYLTSIAFREMRVGENMWWADHNTLKKYLVEELWNSIQKLVNIFHFPALRLKKCRFEKKMHCAWIDF